MRMPHITNPYFAKSSRPDCRVVMFGSSATRLSDSCSDLDLCVLIPSLEPSAVAVAESGSSRNDLSQTAAYCNPKAMKKSVS